MRLFHLLFNFLLGPMVFFAAGGGAASLGGGGGTPAGPAIGDAGAGDGVDAGDGGADAGSDADSDAAAAGADDASHAADADADAADDPNAPVDLGDGRQVPAKFKKLFDAAKEMGLDKEVKQLYFGMQRLAQKFPGGIKQAIELSEAIEAQGGLEAIEGLKSELNTFHADAETFASNPEKWIESGFAENEEASLKAFAHSLDFVGQKFPEEYDHLMAKVIVNDLDQSPVHDIYALLAGLKDNPQAQELAGKLAQFYNARKSISQKVPEKKVDAAHQKLADREAKLNSEQQNLRNHTVNSQTIPRLGRQMSATLEKEAKAAGFDLKKYASEQPRAWQALRSDILNEVMKTAAKDEAFTRNYSSILKAGDTKRAVDLMNKKHDAILHGIATRLAREYGIKKTGKAAPGAKRAAVASGGSNTLRVSAKPASNEIDWTRTGNKIYDSVAVLKNGKTVTWA